MKHAYKLLLLFLVFPGVKAFAVLQFQSGFGHDWGTQSVGVANTQSFTLENTSTTNTILFLGGAGSRRLFNMKVGPSRGRRVPVWSVWRRARPVR